MRRRAFLDLLAASVLAWPRFLGAQPGSKRPVVGVLITDTVGNSSLPILLQGLRDLGYVDGQNIVIAVRSADERSIGIWPIWVRMKPEMPWNISCLTTKCAGRGARP